MSQATQVARTAEQHVPNETHEILGRRQTTCCIVGGGPAGVLLALILARQHVDVTLLEAHTDFDRQFRGDSLHPSALEILDELGLLEGVKQLSHSVVERMPIDRDSRETIAVNIGKVHSPHPYMLLVPQAQFLTYVTQVASQYCTFHLVMGANVRELLEQDGQIQGVRYRMTDGWYEITAPLTIAADGRFSKVRSLAHLVPDATPLPFDSLWFRLPRVATDSDQSQGRIRSEHSLFMLMRTDHWQISYSIPKGTYTQLKAQGLPAVRRAIAEIAPEFTERLEQLQDWNQFSLLSVQSSYVHRWHRPGLLLIGDAAHVMSPVFGVGINYALQDAVEAANVLVPRLQNWQDHRAPIAERYLTEVQLRRALPTLVIQGLQNWRVLGRKNKLLRIVQNFVDHVLPRRLVSRIVSIGLWRVHVQYR